MNFDETSSKTELLDALRSSRAELAVINAIQESLVQNLDMEEIYNAVGDKLVEIFGVQTVVIYSADLVNQMMHFPYTSEKGVKPSNQPSVPINSAYQFAIDQGETIFWNEGLTENVRQFLDYEVPWGELPKSMVVVPVIQRDDLWIGVALQDMDRENVFTESDVSFLETIGNSMRIALENARLFDETQHLLQETEARNAELAVINSVQTGLASKLNMQAIYDLVGDKVSEITGSEIVVINTWDKEKKTVRYEYIREKGERFGVVERPFTPLAEQILPEMAKGKTVIWNDGMEERLKKSNHTLPAGEMPLSVIHIPIKTSSDFNTSISLQDTTKENAFSPSAIRLVETLASSMGIALENARLFDETTQRNAELAVLNSVQAALAAELDMQGIFDAVGDKVRDIFSAQVLAIGGEDPGTGKQSIFYLYEKGKRYYVEAPPTRSGLTEHIFATGETMVINENMEEMSQKYAMQIVAGEEIKSGVWIPYRISGKVRGTISLQHIDQEHAFSEQDVRLLETIANSMGAALENAYLFDETTQRNAELAIVNSVSAETSKNLDVNTVVKIVGDKVQEIFNAEVVVIGLINEEKGLTELPYSYALGEYFEEKAIPFGKGLAGIMFETRRPLLLHTAEELAALGSVETEVDLHKEEIIQSWLGVPIIIGDELVGGVAVQSYRPHAFSESDQRLLTTLSNNMGAVIRNARLFEETKHLLKETEERNAELAVINSVQTGLASKLDMRSIHTLVGDTIQEITHAAVVLIASWDWETRIMHADYFRDGDHQYGVMERPFSTMHDIVFPQLERGETVIWNEGINERYQKYGHVVSAGKIPKTSVAVPLKIGGKINSFISLQDTEKEFAFSPSTIRLVETLAGSMGIALENARLFDELQGSYREISESLERQTATGEVLHIMANSLGEIEPVLEAVAQHAANLCQADDVQIYRVEGNHLRQTAHFGPLPALEDTEILPLEKGLITGRAVLERRTIHIDAGALDEGEFPLSADLQNRLKHRSVIVTPLVREDESVGAIVVRRNDIRPFTEIQIDLLKTFSDQAAIAIENVRLFNETQRLLAESIQQAEELKTVNTVSQALSSELELESLIELVGSQVQKIFSADIAYVALLNKETGLIDFPYNYGQETPTLKFGEGLTSRVIQSGEPLLINQDEDWSETKERIGVKAKSYLGVPIFLGKEAIGVISVQSTRWTNMYSKKEVRLLSTIAGSVGAAFHNANLFDEVERQKEYLESLIASAPVAIITLNLDGIVTSWSPAAEALFGYTEKEAVGKNIDTLVANHPSIREEAKTLTQRFIVDIGKLQLKSQRTHKDGHLIDVNINAVPVKIEDDTIGYITIYNDISEVEKARRDAEEANHAKSAFLANMSHELRTPLNAIIGFTRIVKRKADGALPDKQINNLDKVLVSAEHLLGLINTVLDISKIEAGRMDLHLSNFQLKPLIDLVLATAQPLVKMRTVELTSDLPEDLPAVHSDLEKVKQVLINLLSNAAKFTHEGEISVRVRAVDGSIRVDVSDTGIGISPEAIEHIFEEFQQADSSTTRQYGGTGLGLSISRSLARLLGGDLTATSQVGKGSTFTLTFPVYYGEKAGSQTPDRQEAVPKGDTPLVLTIDDNEDAIYLMKENLEEAGYRVAVARNGEEGLAKAREMKPFAITLDIMMPKKDGWQVLHDLKSDPDTRDIPVIMISIVDKKALGFRLGATDYLVKPLDDDRILETLAKLKRKNGDRPLKSLLVVDDDPNVSDMIQQLLEGSGYQIESASDGVIALEKVRAARPDAILLDLMMPRLDGFGLLEELNKDPAYIDLPIIVLTAKLLTEEEKTALKESAGRVIQKQGLSGEALLAEISSTIKTTI